MCLAHVLESQSFKFTEFVLIDVSPNPFCQPHPSGIVLVEFARFGLSFLISIIHIFA